MTFTPMVLTLAYNPQFALMMSFSLVLALAVVLGHRSSNSLIHMGGLATAILLLRHVRTRTQLVQVATRRRPRLRRHDVASGLLTEQTWSLI